MSSLSIEHKIKILTDNLSFTEIGAQQLSRLTKKEIYGDGVVCGYATIEQQKIILIIQDGNYLNGTMGETHCRKMALAINKAIEIKIPVIIIFESAGVRIQEGVQAMNPAGELFHVMAKASAIIPSIAIMLGANSGAAAYTASLMDFVIMVPNSAMFLTGPKVIEKVLNQKVNIQDLGGTTIHATKTGLASFLVNNEHEGYLITQKLISFITQNISEKFSIDDFKKKDELFFQKYNSLNESNFNINQFIDDLVDRDSFIEINKYFAKNIIVGFATINNIRIGIIANQSACMSGAIDIAASKKMYRFLQICDTYQIPVIFMADSPGFLPGIEEEHSGILGIGARILSVLANSTNAKISIITRKIFGGAYGAMCAKTLGADFVFAWHTAQIGVVGVESAMHLIYAKEIKNHHNDEQYIQTIKDNYINNCLSPFLAAENGLIDGVISPVETRRVIIKCLNCLVNKSEKTNRKNQIILPIG